MGTRRLVQSPRSYVELTIDSEIKRALRTGNRPLLIALDHIRDAAGMPPNPQLSERLSHPEARYDAA